MPRYRNVAVTMWRDPTFRKLSEDGRWLWVYLLTSSQTTAFGLYVFSKDRGASEMQWLRSRLDSTMDELLAEMPSTTLQYDAVNDVVYLPNWLEYNRPNTPNAVKAWRSQLQEIPPETPFIYEWFAKADEHMSKIGESVQETLWETVTDNVALSGSRKQEAGKKKTPPLKFDYDDGVWERLPTDVERKAWEAAYPDINVTGEFLKATAWLVSNTEHRKKRFGRFVNNWLARAQKDAEKHNG